MKKLLALAVVLFSCTGVDGSKRRAADWAQMANIRDVSTISCQPQDSDGDPGYTNAKARALCQTALEPFGVTNEEFFALIGEKDPELLAACPFWPPNKDEVD